MTLSAGQVYYCLICCLGLLAVFAEGVVSPLPFAYVTFNNENCQGKPVATSPRSQDCSTDFPSLVNLFEVGDPSPLIENIKSFSYFCDTGDFLGFGGTECTTLQGFETRLIPQNLCLRGGGVSYRPICPTYPCQPKYKLKRQGCINRINKCLSDHEILMKWTGPGCRNKKGKLVGDGGCQCEGYCGYSCRNACNKDTECAWNNAENVCKHKLFPIPKGDPIPHCLPLGQAGKPAKKPST